MVELITHGTLARQVFDKGLGRRRVAPATPIFHAQMFFGIARAVALAVTDERAIAAANGRQQIINLRRSFFRMSAAREKKSSNSEDQGKSHAHNSAPAIGAAGSTRSSSDKTITFPSGLDGFLGEHRLEFIEVGNERKLVDHFDPAQYGRFLGPAFCRMQIEHIAVDPNQLREALRQHAKIAGLELPGAGIENDNSRAPGWRGHFLAQRALKRNHRQLPPIPVNGSEHPGVSASLVIGFRKADDFNNAGTWNDQAIFGQRYEQAIQFVVFCAHVNVIPFSSSRRAIASSNSASW